MEKNGRFGDQPYEVVVKKLELAELTLELEKVTHKKWETMRNIQKTEEDLVASIAEIVKKLQDMLGKK